MSKLIIVSVCNQFIGIPSKDVLEVVELPKFQPVPFSLPMLGGAAFWRGALLSIVSLARLIAPGREDIPSVYLRTAPPDDNLLLAVNGIEDVIDYNEIKLSEKAGDGVWKGHYPWLEQSPTVLDLGKLVLLLEEQVVETLRLGTSGR